MRRRDERGAILVVLCLMIVPICIVTAVVVDLGIVRWQRASLQNAADAAAVAAGNLLSPSGSQQANGDGLPRAACTAALASLRQNISGFGAADVDAGGGCAGNLPALVSACVSSGGATSTTLTATSGDVVATLVYPLPTATDAASARVAYVRADGSAADPASAAARCRAMSVTVRRSNVGPFFAGVVSSSGQSVTVQSIGATTDAGFSSVSTTTVPGATTTTTTLAPPPVVPGSFVLQSTVALSDCTGNVGSRPYEANAARTSVTWLNMFGCRNVFDWVQAQVWSPYGIGSNGSGTLVVVGDQDRFARWTGCATPIVPVGAVNQTTEGWVGSGGHTFYDVAGVGTHWVAVGSSGQVRVSDDDGVHWHDAALSPGGASPLTEVATDGAGTWVAASSSGVIGTLYRSTDNGEHWSVVTGISGSAVVRTVAYDRSRSQWIAAGSLGTVWTSPTGAPLSWTDTGVKLADGTASGDDLVSITASPTGTVLVAAGGFGRVYRSTTGAAGPYTGSGASIPWSVLPQRVRFGPAGQAVVVGLANAIYQSGDDGVTWSAITSGVPSLRTWDDLANCAVGGQ